MRNDNNKIPKREAELRAALEQAETDLKKLQDELADEQTAASLKKQDAQFARDKAAKAWSDQKFYLLVLSHVVADENSEHASCILRDCLGRRVTYDKRLVSAVERACDWPASNHQALKNVNAPNFRCSPFEEALDTIYHKVSRALDKSQEMQSFTAAIDSADRALNLAYEALRKVERRLESRKEGVRTAKSELDQYLEARYAREAAKSVKTEDSTPAERATLDARKRARAVLDSIAKGHLTITW